MAVNLIKFIGAAYLVYLGLKMLCTMSSRELADNSVTPLSDFAALRVGFFTNALNPKTTVFIVSLFIQVVHPQTPLSIQLAYGAFISFAHIAWFSLVALCFSSAIVRQRLLSVRHWIDRTFGALLVIFGIALVATKAGN